MVKRIGKKGFTLIELMLAMAVFSFVMGICVTVFIQINRLYYRGISITRAQESARNTVEEIKLGLQTSAYSVPANNTLLKVNAGGRTNVPQRIFCIGDQVYYYKPSLSSRDMGAAPAASLGGRRVFSRWTDPGYCSRPLPVSFSVPPSAVDLVDDSTMVHNLAITPSSVDLTISYGAFDQLEGVDAVNWNSPDVRCRGGRNTVFCGVSRVSGEVVRRVQ